MSNVIESLQWPIGGCKISPQIRTRSLPSACRLAVLFAGDTMHCVRNMKLWCGHSWLASHQRWWCCGGDRCPFHSWELFTARRVGINAGSCTMSRWPTQNAVVISRLEVRSMLSSSRDSLSAVVRNAIKRGREAAENMRSKRTVHGECWNDSAVA